jgi:hypothetical protein
MTETTLACPAAVRCEDHVCRCARARELAEIGLTVEAIAVHRQSVTCRMPGQHASPMERVTQDDP